MAFSGGTNGSEPLRWEEERREERSTRLASGTLACPACDAPVAPGEAPLLAGDPLSCPVCARFGTVRDFLSLTAPTRPARVEVRIVRRARARSRAR